MLASVVFLAVLLLCLASAFLPHVSPWLAFGSTASSAPASRAVAAEDDITRPSGVLSFAPFPDDVHPASAVSSLPVCGRVLEWSLVSWSGFGSQLSSLLAAASFAALTSRSFFLDSDEFAYGTWSSYSSTAVSMKSGGGYAVQEGDSSRQWRTRRSLSHSSGEKFDFDAAIGRPAPSSSAPPSPPAPPRVNGSLPVPVVWRVEELLDQWPILGVMPHPTPLSAFDSAMGPSFDDFAEWSAAPRAQEEAAASPSSSLCHLQLDPYALLFHSGSASPPLPLCRAPVSSQPRRPYDWPPLFPNSSAVARKTGRRSSALLASHVRAALVDDDGGCFPAIHCPHGMGWWRESRLQASNIDASEEVQAQLQRLLAPVPPLFFWHRRHLRSLLALRPSIRCQAQRLMDRWGLTPKLDFSQAQHRDSSRRNLTALLATAKPAPQPSPAPLPPPSTTPLAPAASRARFVALHVRRGDKAVELEGVSKAAFGDLERYAVAVEEVARGDKQLRGSWPLMSAANSSDAALFSFALPWAAGMCRQWWRLQEEGLIIRQPHVVLLSDDPAAFHGLMRARPCWQWLTPQLHERWNVSEQRWKEREDGPAASAADATLGWTEGGGHEQWSFNALDAQQREASTHSLLLELALLSLADHAVLTLSSNLGRMTALSRGAWDALVERRVTSLDEAMEQWRPW